MSSFFLDPATTKRYSIARAFTYGDMNYTSAGATAETFASLGFTEVQVQPRPDDRFYIVNSNPQDDGSWDAQPRDLDQLKVSYIAEQKQAQGSLLAATDWMVTRKQEVGVDIPADWSSYRQAVRATGDLRVAALEAVTDLDELQQVLSSELDDWPINPDEMPAVKKGTASSKQRSARAKDE